MRSIIRFFVREHLLSNVLTLLCVFAGVVSISGMRRAIWPDVEFNITVLNTILPGASSEKVEQLVTVPLEESLRPLKGIKSVSSTSTQNQSFIAIELDIDAQDPRRTNADIRRAIDQVTDLPEDSLKTQIDELDADDNGVLEVALSVRDDAKISDLDLAIQAKRVRDELSLLRESSLVVPNGLRDREYIVEASLEQLKRKRVSLQELLAALKLTNVSLPSGTLTQANGEEVLLRSSGEFYGVSDIENAVLRSNASGYHVRVKDVARVRKGLAPATRLYRAGGSPSINLMVSKKKSVDVYDLVAGIKNRMAELRPSIPEGIKIDYINDLSIYLTNRISTLRGNLILGLVLVVLLLMIFVPWPVALVVAVGIPIAFFAALSAAYAIGFSINVVSLLGLILVLGMLVDDAIVVSENIWRHVQQGGESLVDSIVEGTYEVFGAVVASVMTTVSVFSPMLVMSGVMGSFIFEIPSMVILALAFSLLEVFIIMPAHFISWVGPFARRVKAREKAGHGAYEKAQWFKKLTKTYVRFVGWSLKWRWAMGFGLVAFTAATAVLVYKTNRFKLFPTDGADVFFIALHAPKGSSLEHTAALAVPLEKLVSQLPEHELVDFSTSIGIVQQSPSDPFTQRGSHFANLRIRLSPINKRTRTADEIMAEIKAQTPSLKELGLEKIVYFKAQNGPPQGRDIQFSLLGDELNVLKKIALELEHTMQGVTGVQEVQNSYAEGKVEYSVEVLPLRAAQMGLSAFDIAQGVRLAVEGNTVSEIVHANESWDIRVKSVPRYGEDFLGSSTHTDLEQQLRGLVIGNARGALIPLREVSRIKQARSLSSIRRKDYKRAVSLAAEVDLTKSTPIKATAELKKLFKPIMAKYPAYSVVWGGQDRDTKESMASLMRAFGFSIFFVFMLLLITFKNIVQPLIILSSIPLGFAGVSYAMLLHNRPFSFMAMLGMIALGGVIVNNSIVFIDFTNKMLKKGAALKEAILSTSEVRLRPIFLTTMTTVFGLMPTVYGQQLSQLTGWGGSDPFIVPIAMSLAWGLAIGTFLVTLFMPALVHITHDIYAALDRVQKRAFRG